MNKLYEIKQTDSQKIKDLKQSYQNIETALYENGQSKFTYFDEAFKNSPTKDQDYLIKTMSSISKYTENSISNLEQSFMYAEKTLNF